MGLICWRLLEGKGKDEGKGKGKKDRKQQQAYQQQYQQYQPTQQQQQPQQQQQSSKKNRRGRACTPGMSHSVLPSSLMVLTFFCIFFYILLLRQWTQEAATNPALPLQLQAAAMRRGCSRPVKQGPSSVCLYASDRHVVFRNLHDGSSWIGHPTCGMHSSSGSSVRSTQCRTCRQTGSQYRISTLCCTGLCVSAQQHSVLVFVTFRLWRVKSFACVLACRTMRQEEHAELQVWLATAPHVGCCGSCTVSLPLASLTTYARDLSVLPAKQRVDAPSPHRLQRKLARTAPSLPSALPKALRAPLKELFNS